MADPGITPEGAGMLMSRDTGLVTQRIRVTPADPLKEAKTATGGSFSFDGRILVLVLKSGKSESCDRRMPQFPAARSPVG